MSRMPPLPPGLPPRPMEVDSYRPGQPSNDRRDYDRDYDRERGRDRPQMYHFGSDNYQPAPRDTRGYDHYAPPGTVPPSLRPSYDVYRPQFDQGPPPAEFTFRHDPPPAVSAPTYQALPSQPRRDNDNKQRNNARRQDHTRRRSQGHGGGRGSYRGRGGPRMASNRAFLKGNREPTPELMPGMDEEDAGVRFKPIEAVSDSDEAEMDISDDENTDAEQPKKKARTAGKATDGDSVPRWSNPDPYTALPPPDESQRKKKDVVKLIRKARVETGATSAAKFDPADDFISFDFGDDGDELNGGAPHSGTGVSGAPTGPRFSHHTNLHNNQTLHARTDFQNNPDDVGHQNLGGPVTDRSHQARADRNGQISNENLSFDSNIPRADRTLAIDSRPSKSVNLDTTSDPALGSRKRNIRDEIKPAPILHRIGRGVSKKPVNGNVLKEWEPLADVSGTPWVEIDHSDTANMGLWTEFSHRLHKEIMDFYHFVKPREFESVIRAKLIENLRATLKASRDYSDTDIHSFGSFPAGLYLPTADMDLVCVSDHFMRTGRPILGNRNAFYHTFGGFIRRQGLALENSMEIINKAKVPLVKYIDKFTGLKVDISFENTTGLVANQTFQNWKAQFPAMPILVTLIKHLLAMRGLNEPVNGGIGGFSVTCLVVSLLQNMPQVQSRTMIPEHHLGEILMEFFDLYGNQFNATTTAIQVDRPGYLSKARHGGPYNAKNRDRLSIIDPNNPDNDISGGAGNTQAILTFFSRAYRDLQKRMGELHHRVPSERRKESILGCILAGNYSSFQLQREHLAHVYEKLHLGL